MHRKGAAKSISQGGKGIDVRYVTPEEIQRAREIDAFSYLQTYCPGELVKLGNGVYCTKTHDSLKLSHGKWFWWSQGFGGVSALDYLVKVEKVDFVDAVKILNKRAGFIPPSSVSKNEEPRIFCVPLHNYECKTVRAYLKKRCISDDVINYFIGERILAEENKTGYCLFFGNDDKGAHKQCSVRATDGRDFKKEVYGSIKDYSFQTVSRTPRDCVRVFECAIDLMSFATLMEGGEMDFHEENMMSVSGVYMPKKDLENSKVPASLLRFLEQNPSVKKVILHFDNDPPGRLAAKGITAALSGRCEVKYVPPPREKDFNAYLCVMKTEEIRVGKRREERA